MLPGKICSVFGWLLPAWLCAPTAAAGTYGSTLILQIPIKASVSIPSAPAWTGLLDTYKKCSGVMGVSYARESGDEHTIDLFIGNSPVYVLYGTYTPNTKRNNPD